MHGGTLLKSLSAVGFSEKLSFWESVSYHQEMFGVTTFGLVLCICIVNAIIFIKKTLVNLFRISFYELLKIIKIIILAMLEKFWLVFFFKLDFFLNSDPKSENMRSSVLKIRLNAHSGILNHYFFKNKT